MWMCLTAMTTSGAMKCKGCVGTLGKIVSSYLLVGHLYLLGKCEGGRQACLNTCIESLLSHLFNRACSDKDFQTHLWSKQLDSCLENNYTKCEMTVALSGAWCAPSTWMSDCLSNRITECDITDLTKGQRMLACLD